MTNQFTEVSYLLEIVNIVEVGVLKEVDFFHFKFCAAGKQKDSDVLNEGVLNWE